MGSSGTKSLPKAIVDSTEETLIRVLYVDNEAGLLKVAKPILEMHAPFHVETASSVEEAMEKMEEKTFDVIVSDYIMPGKDGLEFLKELRESRNNIPFIIFTGKGREIVAIKALNLGADQYINKIGKPEAVYSELAHGILTVVKGKKAEEALRESEEKFRNLAEKLPNMIFINKKGGVVYANKRCEEIMGYKRKEFYSPDFNFFTLIAPQSIELLKSIYSRHLKGEEILPYEYTLITKEGKKIEAILTSKLITYEGETAILGIITDITERKQIEKQLKESEEKYHKQFEESLDAIFLADAETGIIVDCNRAATKLIGRKKSELIGKHQRILHPPEEITGEFSRTFRQHRKEKEGQVLETQVIKKTGEIRDVAIKANIFEMGNKKVLQGVFRDVTDKKKIEEQLRQERETLELVTENIGAGLTIISKDYKILWANKFLKNLCGNVKGKTCYSVYNDRTSICPGCGVKEIFETGKDHVVHEQSVPGPDGQRVWIEITANPIRDEKGNIVAASELSVFINERKQLESKLREAEKRYHALFDKAPLGILIIDSTGTAVEFNEEAHRQLGYSKEEFEKLTVSDYEVLETPNETRAHMKKILKTGKDEFETKHRTKTGEIRDIINTVQVIELSGKKFFHVITRDINEQKKAEEALRESEKYLVEILNSVLTGVVIIDEKTHEIVDANPNALEKIGASKEHVIGKVCHCFICPAEKGKCPISDLGQTVDRSERVLLRANGERIPIIKTVTTIMWRGHKYLIESFIDITERKKMENKILQQNEFLNSALEALTHPFYVIDADDYTIQLANSATGFGNLAENSTCYQVTHKRKKPCSAEHPCPLEIVKKTKKPAVTEHIHYDKNGNERNVEVHGYPIFDNDGNVVQMIEYSLDITEQKKVEETLRESEEKYRELLNGMNDTAWVIDFDGNIIDVNDSAVEVLGYSREEFRSIGLTGIDSNLDPEEIKGLVEGMPSDEIQVFETAHTTKDGKKIPVEISSSLVTYQGKQAILSIARNITERKRAEKKLRQSEERYRTVLENTGTAMCIIEEDKTISMVNRRFEELSGYSWEELEGKKWTEFVTKEYLERMKRYHEARRKRGGKVPMHYPFDFVNKKGQIRNCLLTVNMILGTKNSVASILDITESKKTEKALREAEEKYRETIVNANVGIIGYSPEGEVKVLNQKMEQMIGFKRSEIPTLRDWFKKLYPNEEERCKVRDKWFKRMSEEGEVKEGHAIITTKDGKRRNFLFNAVQLESGDSIAFANDITERKEAEEKLDRMMNELATINEKLGVVGKLTRHDARNKLSVIANNIYLAKQKLTGDDSALEYLGEVESTIGQVEEIFNFARTYEMLGVEDLSYVDVEKSVKEAAMLFSDLDDAKLVNECHGLMVMADSLLRQLFYNLIDDTLKHGEKVSQIRVYYKKVKDQLKLVYEDDGVGIPEAEKELIFKEGYGKGTGYGLYLIKKICEAYGWTIQETGKSGKGAQFTMTIPKMNKNGKISYIIN